MSTKAHTPPIACCCASDRQGGGEHQNRSMLPDAIACPGRPCVVDALEVVDVEDRQPGLRRRRPRRTVRRRPCACGQAVRLPQSLQVPLEGAAVVQAGELVAFTLVHQRGVVGVDPGEAVEQRTTRAGWRGTLQLQRADRATLAQDRHDQQMGIVVADGRLHFQPLDATTQREPRRIVGCRNECPQVAAAVLVGRAVNDALQLVAAAGVAGRFSPGRCVRLP